MKPLYKLFYIASIFFVIISCQDQKKIVHSFSLSEEHFLLDDQPLLLISGEMHYPRIPREAWRSRMKAAKAMGINTIGTYVFWNVHEPQKGEYNFAGNNDIAAFIQIAQEEGLWVVLRPSPYVCAEWEFGGYPYWLQNEEGLVVRSTEPKYLNAYRLYINEVGKQLSHLQINHGGNILMTQIENEYGFHGEDKDYLEINRQIFIEAGFDGLLYTSDPPSEMKNGHLAGLLPAVNGLDDPKKVKELINTYHNGKGPYYIAEWYPAWFDSWGLKHHKIPAQEYAPRLDSVLAAGVSINMYMFHGGTTRGFMNGANFNDKLPFQPQLSSYDYDAPLDEAGNPTEKFEAFRKVILKYLPVGMTLPEIPAKKPTIKIPEISFSKSVDLFNVLPLQKTNEHPLSFEALYQDYGFVLYRTTLKNKESGILKIEELRDYGIVFINGKRVGVIDRRLKQDSLHIDIPEGLCQLDILVENLGRINFGPYLLDNKKGITKKVFLNNEELLEWQMFSLPFADVNEINLEDNTPSSDSPIIRKGSFSLPKTGDTYLDLSEWGKGCVWVNGYNLGRYWEIGPQQTIYLPAEWQLEGANEIIIFELLKTEQTQLQALEEPILDQLKQHNK